MLVSDESVKGARTGLRTKFIVAFAVQTITIALAIVLVQQWLVRRTMQEQTVEQARAIAVTVESTAAYYVLFGLTDDLRHITTDLRRNASIEYADFVDSEGTVLSATDRNVPGSVSSMALRRADGVPVGGDAHLFIIPFYESRADLENPAAKPRGYFRLLTNNDYAASALESLVRWTFLIVFGALLLSMALAYIAATYFIRPILALAGTAQQIAQGDLTQRATAPSVDEVGQLAESFNSMSANLERTVRSVLQSQAKLKSVVETVDSRSRTVIERVDQQRTIVGDTSASIDKLNAGVRKITDNVEALSAASEETSSSMLEMVASMEEVSRHTDTLWSSVEETASATHQMVSSITGVDENVAYLRNFVIETSSSMVQMSASIAAVESNAAKSYDLALAVAEAAESGMKAVRETIEGMEQIRRSVAESNSVIQRLGERSFAIGRILTVIEDVAEQTNLLALNAAILAAQAGEHGKGFSVVAAEIRELSERTASSTRDIGNLIKSVQEEVANAAKTMAAGSNLVEEGVTLSHDAGTALTRILDSASKASGMGREIANATREQAAGSETITRAVERLQEMVKQISSATAQQSAGSDHILKAVESMREVTRYVRQAMIEQKSGSSMISAATDRMIEMIHEIFQAAANQATESEKIVDIMEQVRVIAEGNRDSAAEMSEAIVLLNEAIRSLEDEVRKFRVH